MCLVVHGAQVVQTVPYVSHMSKPQYNDISGLYKIMKYHTCLALTRGLRD